MGGPPQRHTLLFERQVVVDTRVVCTHNVKKMLRKQAKMVWWTSWAAMHEVVRVWLEPIHVAKKDQRVVDRQAPSFDGCRKECTTLNGRTERSVEAVTTKRARKSSTTVRHGEKSGTRYRKDWGHGNREQNGEALEMAKRYLVASSGAEVLGGKATCQPEGGSLKKHRSWAAHCKDYGTMSPPMSLGWESQARGVRVGGQWCGFIMTRRWDQCMECADLWMLSLMRSAPSRELS